MALGPAKNCEAWRREFHVAHPNLTFVSVKPLLKVGLDIDRPTESTHRRFELPVAMCANSNDWS